jgi:glycosyltransferase involved in cell wall biosynthesis
VRVLLFIGTLRTGGAERQFGVLADGLLGNGVETLLTTMTPGGPNWERFAAGHAHDVVSLEPRAQRGGVDAARQHLAAPVELRRLIRRFRPDVVYSALEMTNAIAWMATRGTRTALAWGVRSSEEDLNLKRAAPFQFCRLVSGTVPLAIANARAARDLHIRRGFRPKRFEVVANGIDTDHFRPDAEARAARRREWGVTAGQTVIGTVGRLVAPKGHEVLLRAARDVLAQLPDARFVVVGDGKAPDRDRLAADAARLGLDGKVLWLGHRPDTADVYPGFDVFCLPSLSESFPNVVGEAMACGLDCVVTDVGDAPVILGGTGRVVPPGDPVKLAENIIWAARHSADRDGDARRQRIVDAFSVARMVRRTHDLLESLVASTSPS